VEGPCAVLVRTLLDAIRAGKRNMPDDNRGDIISNKDGVAEFVWVE
jgi:hypothetical protein